MGYVYVIRAGDTNYYKVGISIHYPNQRLAELQTGNHLPLKLIDVYETTAYNSVELLMHQVLSKYHTVGEWFDVDYSVIENKLNELKLFLTGNENADTDFEGSTIKEIVSNPHLTCKCGLAFKTRSGLGKHKRTCEAYV